MDVDVAFGGDHYRRPPVGVVGMDQERARLAHAPGARSHHPRVGPGRSRHEPGTLPGPVVRAGRAGPEPGTRPRRPGRVRASDWLHGRTTRSGPAAGVVAVERANAATAIALARGTGQASVTATRT